MDVNNLTSVYNQNPTLQGSYTLQQYLDLFGGSSTPANTNTNTSTTTTTTPTTTNSGQGIINSNINQYQNQGVYQLFWRDKKSELHQYLQGR